MNNWLKVAAVTSAATAAATAETTANVDATKAIDTTSRFTIPPQQQRNLGAYTRFQIPNSSSIPKRTCLTESQCNDQRAKDGVPRNKYYVGNYPDHGCFAKNGMMFWGVGGSDKDKAADVNGVKERVWCDWDVLDGTWNGDGYKPSELLITLLWLLSRLTRELFHTWEIIYTHVLYSFLPSYLFLFIRIPKTHSIVANNEPKYEPVSTYLGFNLYQNTLICLILIYSEHNRTMSPTDAPAYKDDATWEKDGWEGDEYEPSEFIISRE